MFRDSHSTWVLLLGAFALCALTGCTPAPTDGGGDGGGGGDVGNVNDNVDGNGGGTGDGGGAGNGGQGSGIIADHLATAAFEDIPAAYGERAKSDYRIFYGHTSHGSQIITGMNMLDTGPGTLSIEENDGADLGYEGDLTWVDITREVLDRPGGDINMVMWAWCGSVSENTEEGINTYLSAMNGLEGEYPQVRFVYMTGHLDGTGPSGNLYARNNQIRDYCRDNDKVLYDFADIESYDPDGNYYPDGSDYCEWCEEWCASRTCSTCEDCAHSVCFNCYQKGRAFWWMMARIAGWSGSPSDTTPSDGGGAGGDGTDGGDVSDGGASGGSPTERLQPADFRYEGAFRLPEEFNWGARGLSFYPEGNGGAGSLLVTGFELLSDPAHSGESCWDPAWDCYASFGEVAIPTLAVESSWENLPQATLLTPLTSFDGGLASTVHREYIFVSGIQYMPERGSQTGDKIYGSITLWYAEGAVGEDTFPTVWFSDLDGTGAQGMFHVGPEESPYHGRKMGSYLFSVPEWYADQYLGGRTLVTGRSRGTPLNSFEEISVNGGSQGPTLFAFYPWESDSASGDLDALPMLYYRVNFPGCAGPNVGDPAECDYPDFTMCDEWTGAAFVDIGSRRAIMLLGYKGLGENCYDEPPVNCNDPCSVSHGYHCQPYERQVILYDVHELGQSALGRQDPWVVLPYMIWRPEELYLSDDPCWNMGGMTFDAQSGRLFMVERGLGASEANTVVVHVWSATSGAAPAG